LQTSYQYITTRLAVSNKLWMNLIPKAMLVFVHTQRASVQGVMNLMLSNLYLDKLPAFLPGHEADYFYIHTHHTQSWTPDRSSASKMATATQ
jgi:hypothetical protein